MSSRPAMCEDVRLIETSVVGAVAHVLQEPAQQLRGGSTRSRPVTAARMVRGVRRR
ncbi:hypothetical protein [Streptomyces sp. NPDC029041]|uniref:hypothetical protein n=1 Tax=Streptomyces sp. NPDC029041 TaxID=3155727 RepID=UPI0033D1C7F4